MPLLQEWRPFRELDRLRDEFDDLMKRFTGDLDWFREWEPVTIRPQVESFIEGDKLTIRADLPGIDPKDVEVNVTGDMLTIRGKREEKYEEKKRHFVRREVRYGSFERTLELPQGVKAEDIKATYRDGVLELAAPLPKELERKQLKIQVESAQPKKAEAKAS